jgi:carbohydrate diacid regulator
MLLNFALARQIAEKANQVLKREIFITGLSGQLLAGATDPKISIPDALTVAQTGHPQSGHFNGRATKWWPFIYEDQTIAVFGLAVDTGPITQEAIMLLQGLAEVIVYQHYLLDKMQSSERLRADFLRLALTAPTFDPVDIYHQADILQLRLRTPHAVMLIHIDGFAQSIREQHRDLSSEEQSLELATAAETINSHVLADLRQFPDNLIAYFEDDYFALLKGVNSDSPTTLNTIRTLKDNAVTVHKSLSNPSLGHTITIGVGQYYPDLAGLRKSYQDAKLALDVGARVWGRGRGYHIKDVGMFITLAGTSQDRKAELAHQILSPLLRDEQLFKTVQSFLASGLNLTAAAEKLHIHRNTLIYRLDKTKKLVGLDPRHFDDALQIKLGLMFYTEPSRV